MQTTGKIIPLKEKLSQRVSALSRGSTFSAPSQSSSTNYLHHHKLTNALYGIKALHKDIQAFLDLLNSSSGIKITTKELIPTEHQFLEKTGHLLTTTNDDKIGFLISQLSTQSCTKRCFDILPDENDPINYYIASSTGTKLLEIFGLDEDSGTKDVVIVTQNQTKNILGTIIYGYLGANADSVSRETSRSGREKAFMIPTSVIDPDRDLMYIFRESPLDYTCTELLSADGNATVVAKMAFEYQNLNCTADTDCNNGDLKTSDSVKSKPEKVFRVDFIQDVEVIEKTLIIGVAVAVLNRWLKIKSNKSCCKIT